MNNIPQSLSELVEVDSNSHLGKGAFGHVVKVKRASSNTSLSNTFALKSIAKNRICFEETTPITNSPTGPLYPIASLQEEIRIQGKLNHPNIVCLYNYFEDENFVYILLEYCNSGEFYSMLRGSPGRCLRMGEAAQVFAQVCDAISFLHSHGIAHRDIKPENLLLSTNNADNSRQPYTVKLTDFGWAIDMNKNSNNSKTQQLHTFCGILDYLAPEMLFGTVMVGEEHYLDLWSLGILLYEILCGYPPFHSTDSVGIVNRIINVDYTAPLNISSCALELIRHLIQKDAKKRISANVAREHPFVVDNLAVSNQPPLSSYRRSYRGVEQPKNRPQSNTINKPSYQPSTMTNTTALKREICMTPPSSKNSNNRNSMERALEKICSPLIDEPSIKSGNVFSDRVQSPFFHLRKPSSSSAGLRSDHRLFRNNKSQEFLPQVISRRNSKASPLIDTSDVVSPSLSFLKTSPILLNSSASTSQLPTRRPSDDEIKYKSSKTHDFGDKHLLNTKKPSERMSESTGKYMQTTPSQPAMRQMSQAILKPTMSNPHILSKTVSNIPLYPNTQTNVVFYNQPSYAQPITYVHNWMPQFTPSYGRL